jgi:hypothetical protein
MMLTRRSFRTLALGALLLAALAGQQTAEGVVTSNTAMCGTGTGTPPSNAILVPCTSLVLVGNRYWTKGPAGAAPGSGRIFVKWVVVTNPPDETLFVGPATNDACIPNQFFPQTGYANQGRQQCNLSTVSGGPFVPGSPADLRVGIDDTPPVVSVTPSRPPDLNGWYRSPVTVTWSATDPALTSGPPSCTAPVLYSTDTTALGADVPGTCTDPVGNSASKTLNIKYDGTPPGLTGVTASAGGGGIVVRWQSSGATNVEVARVSGLSGGTPVVIYNSALGGEVIDQAVIPEISYTYRVTATDQAGNTTVRTATASVPAPPPTPAPSPSSPTPPPVVASVGTSLLRPADGRVLAGAPVLRWPAVAKARFYNIQVFIRGKKVLSAWPKTTRYTMHYKWKYLRKRYRLPKGVKVRWYVWPAFGTLAAPKYGKLIGTSSFIFKR